MAEPGSSKPYLIRAIYEWCVDNGLTPYLVLMPDENTLVPQGNVREGEITLNINYSATKDLQIGNDVVTFSARFNGAAFNIYAPIDVVRGIYARENGQGMFFGSTDAAPPDGGADSNDKNVSQASPIKKISSLRLVK